MKLKRFIDIVIGVLLSAVTAPIIVVLATGSAISYRSWPFFVQDRVGLHGRIFRIVKIRSLPISTPPDLVKYELPTLRTTRWGMFLRRYHLDELPQVWLVVTGRMSLVGPRPEMPFLSASFDPAFVQDRTSIRQGCTGLWQVSSSSRLLIGEAPVFDLYYLANRTTRLDLWILVRTFLLLVGFAPIHSVDEIPLWVLASQRSEILRGSPAREADQAA